MSQYTISLRAYIHIVDSATNNCATFADVNKKIELGRKIFFDFDYSASAEFKELFERAFLLHNFDNDIYCDDIDKFKMRLENDVKIKIPMFYKAWRDLTDDKYSIMQNSSYSDNVIENSKDSGNENASNQSTATSSGKDKTLGSSFPNDIERASDADEVKYMNSGTIGKNSSESNSSGTSQLNRETYREGNRNIEHVEIGNVLEKLRELEKQSFDIINAAVGSFSNLFMLVW